MGGKPRDKVGEEIRRRLGVRGRKGAALTGRNSRNGGGGGVEQRNRGKEGRLKTTGPICNFPKF
jgi:hypothetical protein